MNVGFGKEKHGTQIKTWTKVDKAGSIMSIKTSHTITGDEALDKFSGNTLNIFKHSMSR